MAERLVSLCAPSAAWKQDECDARTRGHTNRDTYSSSVDVGDAVVVNKRHIHLKKYFSVPIGFLSR